MEKLNKIDFLCISSMFLFVKTLVKLCVSMIFDTYVLKSQKSVLIGFEKFVRSISTVV